jgi:hypothetical protein
MKNYHSTRLVAFAAVVALLLAFATPVAAAPGSGISLDTTWSPASFFQWVQFAWTGWFGVGGASTESSGIGNVYDQQTANNEPDGVAANALSGAPTVSVPSFDGTF